MASAIYRRFYPETNGLSTTLNPNRTGQTAGQSTNHPDARALSVHLVGASEGGAVSPRNLHQVPTPGIPAACCSRLAHNALCWLFDQISKSFQDALHTRFVGKIDGFAGISGPRVQLRITAVLFDVMPRLIHKRTHGTILDWRILLLGPGHVLQFCHRGRKVRARSPPRAALRTVLGKGQSRVPAVP